MKNAGKKIFELDALRTFSNFLIVFVHCSTLSVVTESCLATDEAKASLNFLCYVVSWSVMPVFFFVSGYLMMRGFNFGNYRSKVKRRLKRLVVPYIFWNGLFVAGFYVCCRWGLASSARPTYVYFLKIFGMFTQPMDTPLWYVRVLLFFLSILPLIYCIVRRARLFWCVLLLGCFLNVLFSRLGLEEKLQIIFPLYSLPAFLLGCWLSHREVEVRTLFVRFKWLFLALGALAFLVTVPSSLGVSWLVTICRGLTWMTLVAFIPVSVLVRVCKSHVFQFVSAGAFFLYAAHRYPCWWTRSFVSVAYENVFSKCGTIGALLLAFVEVGIVISFCYVCYWALNRFFPILGRILSGN